MKRTSAIFIFLFVLAISLQAQREANIWYFGTHAGIDFNSGMPVALSNSQMDTYEGCASIADPSTGQLLFYTDGITIWNANHQVMPNGSGLDGNSSSTQSAIIVPDPASPQRYYVFTVDAMGGSLGLRYNHVDMSLQSGLGDILPLEKNIPMHGAVCEKLTACKNAAGTGFWVIAHDFGNSDFLAFEVSASGVTLAPVTSTTGSVNGAGGDIGVGYMKVSPDGTRLALTNYTPTLECFTFDNSTGSVTFDYALDGVNYTYGLSFSPDSKLLYTARQGTNSANVLTQYNLQLGNAAAVIAAKVEIFNSTLSFTGALQIAPDGKIYQAHDLYASLGVINSPNVIGMGCNYVDVGFVLPSPSVSRIGLPDFTETIFANSSPTPPPADTTLCLDKIDPALLFPNVMTPNDDAINDGWELLYPAPANFSVQVYDRWGALVFKACNPGSIRWDGKNRSGQEVQAGTYYWLFEFTSPCDGKSYTRKGFVTVIR